MALFVGKPVNLAINGPLLGVKLCVPQQVQAKWPPIDTLAEVNTASIHTYIQEGVATSLGLAPKDTITITTMTSRAYESYVYHIRLVFQQGKAVEVLAIEVPYMLRPHARIKCVIGRDILQFGVLTYNGRGNTFTFDF
jgi:hypothetical protein